MTVITSRADGWPLPQVIMGIDERTFSFYHLYV